MRKFISTLLLFTLPIAVIIGLCMTGLLLAGELDGEENHIEPLEEGQLIGLAYTDNREAYKFKMTDSIFRPDVIALGSSRIMQVKSYVIGKGYSFYNAGGAANNIYHYQMFLDRLHYTPKLLIVNIDQFLFNPHYQNQKESLSPEVYEFSDYDWVTMLNSFVEDIFSGKVQASKLLNNSHRHIGLNAIMNNIGYMRDGSHFLGFLINNPESPDYDFKDTFERIEKGNRRFEYCSRTDSSLAVVVDRFLTTCEQRQITVVAILPPFAPAIYSKMEAMGTYAYLSQIYDILSPCFARHRDCYLYDYTDMSALGVHNYDFLDGYHGSEHIYNLLLLDILNKEPGLRKYFVSTNRLEAINEAYRQKHIRYHSLN